MKPEKKIKELLPEYSLAETSLIGWWWAAYIITNFVSRISFKLALKSDTVLDMMTSSQLDMLSDFLDTIAAVVTILVIKKVSAEETVLFNAVNNPSGNKIQEQRFSVA